VWTLNKLNCFCKFDKITFLSYLQETQITAHFFVALLAIFKNSSH
jgi:hypothetical protein